MLSRALILAASLCALTACGAPAAGTDNTAEAATAVVVTDVPCEGPAWFTEDVANQREVFFETLYEAQSEDDATVAIAISGPEGSSCTGSAMEGQTLVCVMQGPIFGLAIQDTVQYRIPEGRTATLTHSGVDGSSTCFLNEAAG